VRLGSNSLQSVIVALSLASLAFGFLVGLPSPAAAYTPHATIVILGDADFTAANGVTAGTGTWNDPYVIEGWEINASAAHGIEVRGTTASFVIRDVYVHSGRLAFNDGIRFGGGGVSNAQVYNVTLERNHNGFRSFGGDNVTLSAVTAVNNRDSGVDLGGTDNVTLLSSRLNANGNGLDAPFVTGFRIDATEFIGNEFWGAFFIGGGDATITAATFSNTTATGAVFYGVDNATITDATVSGNGGGMVFNASTNMTLTATRFLDGGLTIAGSSLAEFNTHTITPDNTVNGAPLRYVRDVSGVSLDGLPTGQLIVANATDVTVSNLTIGDGDGAITLAYVDNAEVRSSRLSGARAVALSCARVRGLRLSANTFERHQGGISLRNSENISLEGNGLLRSGALGGLQVLTSSNVSITANVFQETLGSALAVSGSSSVNIQGNSFLDSSGRLRVSDDGGTENTWDGGYPVGGNFWSSYSGPDRAGGPAQDQPGPDGLGDVPFVIDADSQDTYPLVATVPGDATPPSVAITAPPSWPPVQSTSMAVTGTASDNLGVSRVEVRVNGGPWSDASGTLDWSANAELVPGLNRIEARAWDLAGNPSPVALVELTQDSAPPALTLSGPQNNAVVSAPLVVVSGTADPGAVVAVNGLLAAVAQDGAFSVSIPLQEGPNLVAVTARDAAGNTASASLSVTYAPPAPSEFDWVMPAFLTAFFSALLALLAFAAFRPREPEETRSDSRPDQER
jgi:hypothetical protein